MRGVLLILALAVLGLLPAIPAMAAEPFKLSDALALAYTSNPELEAQRARVRTADDAVAEARGGYRPSVNVAASYGFNRTDVTDPTILEQFTPVTGRAVISQPVTTGGQVYAQVQRAIALVRAARADLLSAEEQILLAAATAYMDVVRDTEALRLHQSDVDVLTRQRDATKIQLDAGDATKTDLQEVEVRIAGAEADLALAEAQLAQSRDSFERVIGRPAETLEDAPPMPWMPGSPEQALAMALRESPRIQSAQANDRAAQYGVDNAVGALLPHTSIVAEFDYNQDSLASGFGLRAKVSSASILGQISVPLYQGGADDARIREAKGQRAQTRLGIVDADQQTRQAVRDALASFHGAQTAVGFNQHRVTASELALDGVIQQQHQGERSILDILNAEQERLGAQIALASARHDMIVASYQVLSATGRLTAKTLALNVKLYDPQDHYDDNAGKWIGFGE